MSAKKESCSVNTIPKLDTLDLSENAISDVSPLSELDSLIFLNLTANQIKDVSPLGSLANLEFLLGRIVSPTSHLCVV